MQWRKKRWASNHSVLLNTLGFQVEERVGCTVWDPPLLVFTETDHLYPKFLHYKPIPLHAVNSVDIFFFFFFCKNTLMQFLFWFGSHFFSYVICHSGVINKQSPPQPGEWKATDGRRWHVWQAENAQRSDRNLGDPARLVPRNISARAAQPRWASLSRSGDRDTLTRAAFIHFLCDKTGHSSSNWFGQSQMYLICNLQLKYCHDTLSADR